MSDTPKFEILKKAGVTQTTFGALVGVSRVTVNTWVRGQYSPTHKTRKRVSAVLDAISDLVDSGRLPLKSRVDVAQVDVIEQQIDNHTPAE